MSDAFLRHLTLKIRPSIFLPGEFIVHKGDVGLGMFFLYHGKVSGIPALYNKYSSNRTLHNMLH